MRSKAETIAEPVPDLWGLARCLQTRPRKRSRDAEDGALISDCWHLAHELRRRLLESDDVLSNLAERTANLLAAIDDPELKASTTYATTAAALDAARKVLP